jgi:uncharacterized protein (UPF0248 family)
MIPIQDLLHRIQWDPEFDRVTREIVRVPFRRVHFEKGEHFAFEAIEEDGSVHSVPLHRVREVWRNGELVWQRAPPTP